MLIICYNIISGDEYSTINKFIIIRIFENQIPIVGGINFMNIWEGK